MEKNRGNNRRLCAVSGYYYRSISWHFFALIANTPVIILKTTDHKVVTGADWFEGVYEDYVYVVNDLEEASQVAQQIVTGFEYRKLPSYFKEKYYDRLKDIIEYGELKNDNL